MDKLYDMSAEHVTLNLEALIDMAGTAVRNAKSHMDRCQAQIDSAIFPGSAGNDYRSNHTAQFYANELAKAAKEYAVAWGAYFALVECKRREKITIDK